MARKKTNQPLLYIQQPAFQNQAATMQQFFINKRKKQNDAVEKNHKDSFNENDKKAEIKESISSETSSHHLVMANKIDLAFLEESQEANVMEFMLEGILTPCIEAEMKEEIQTKINVNMIKEEVIISTKEHEKIVEENNNSHELKYEKRNKRMLFNELSLENKIKQLKKMPAMVVRFLYEFVTEEKTYKGYFLLSDENKLRIQIFENFELIDIEENKIIDLKIIGL